MSLHGFYLRPVASPHAGQRIGGPREKSASRSSQMSKHMLACFVVHISFEAVSLLQRGCRLSCWASADLIKETLEVREVAPGALTQDERHHTRPAPQGHVDDGVSLTHHVALTG